MYRRVFAVLSLCLLAAVIFPWLQVRAQSPLTLSTLEVDLWPEYDRTAVLVIYRVTLPASVSLPADLTFRIPASAGEPSAVAVRQTSNGESGLFTIPYERQVSGEWGLITLNATMPELQIEYYDPDLLIQGSARQYAYNWPGDYTVDNFIVQVQQPVGASDMRISPDAGAGVPGRDEMTYYNKQVGQMSAGQSFTLSFSYQKSSDSLSVSSLSVQPEAPLQAETAFDYRKTLIWILGALGVALIAGGGFWYYQSGRSRGSERGRDARRRHRPSAQREADDTQGDGVYCHQCGKRALPGDRFCRVCGTPLRLS